MKRTTVSLPEELAQLLELEAKRRNVSVSEVVRQALQAHLGSASTASPGKRRVTFAGLGRSGKKHTARNAEKILAAEWGSARRR